MMENAGGVSFPVVFFDGERETNIGNVMVYPSLEFKSFQLMMSRRIGISPHQLSVYLAVNSRSESPRKIPITGKFNFAAISRDQDCFFLVVLKRSRRERRRKNKRELHEEDVYYAASMNVVNRRKAKVPENVMLLRRNGGVERGFLSPIMDRVGYEKRMRDLQMERERYLMNMGLSGLCLGKEENGVVGPGEREVIRDRNRNRNGVVFCDECLRANEMGREVGFHWCVYDAVTFGFRSPAGPIARPVK